MFLILRSFDCVANAKVAKIIRNGYKGSFFLLFYNVCHRCLADDARFIMAENSKLRTPSTVSPKCPILEQATRQQGGLRRAACGKLITKHGLYF